MDIFNVFFFYCIVHPQWTHLLNGVSDCDSHVLSKSILLLITSLIFKVLFLECSYLYFSNEQSLEIHSRPVPVWLSGAARAAECRHLSLTSSPQPGITSWGGGRRVQDEALHKLSTWGQRRGTHAGLRGVSEVRAQRSLNLCHRWPPSSPQCRLHRPQLTPLCCYGYCWEWCCHGDRI